MFRVLGVYNFDTYVNVFHKPGSKILRGILSPSWDSKERPTSVANKQIFTLLLNTQIRTCQKMEHIFLTDLKYKFPIRCS